jgi:hypothetical protein
LDESAANQLVEQPTDDATVVDGNNMLNEVIIDRVATGVSAKVIKW